MSFAFLSLLYSDDYLPGALVLAHSLISQNSIIPRGILITNQVSEFAKSELSKVYDHIILVDPIIADDKTPGFQLLDRPELANAYTKIHVWNQTQFSKIVFLDADTLTIKNVDDLFSDRFLNHNNKDDLNRISAAPDIGWPDIFNSGVFVACPNKDTFENLRIRALDTSGKYSFDGGDQGLLNQYFTESSNWNRLPFIYNVTPSTSYQYLPAYSYYHSQVSIVHFIGSVKPWQGEAPGNREMASKWRSIYRQHYGERLLSAKPVQPESKAGGITPEFPSSSAQQTTAPPAPPPPPAHPTVHVDHEAIASAAVAAAAALERLRIASQKETKIIPPAIDRWDATKFIPPIDSKPEAPHLTIDHYDNAWDSPKPEPKREVPVGFQFPKFGKSTATLWQTPQPPLERVFPEDLPPAKTKSPKQLKKKSSAGSFSERLKGYGKSFNWTHDEEEMEEDEDEEHIEEESQGFQFPKLGKSVVQLPWETQDRPKVERVYPEDLPPPAYEEIQARYKQQFSNQRRESLEASEGKVGESSTSTSTSSASSSSSKKVEETSEPSSAPHHDRKSHHGHHRHESKSESKSSPSASKPFVLKPILKHPKRTLDKDEEIEEKDDTQS